MMIWRKRKSADEVNSNKERVIVKKTKAVYESMKNNVERVTAQNKRKLIDAEKDQNKKNRLILKKCKKFDDEDEEAQSRKEKKIVRKRKSIDEEEDQYENNRLILKKCRQIDGFYENEDEQNRKNRLIVRKGKQNDDSKGEGDEEEQNRNKRVIVRKGKKIDDDKKKQVIVRRSKKIDDDDGEEKEQTRKNKGYLPEELVIENILTRLPAQKLAQCRCVCKLWCNTIANDKRFAELHFVMNKNNPYLVFNRLNVMLENESTTSYFFSLEKDDNDHHLHCKSLIDVTMLRTSELVGYCNGLACIRQVSYSGDEGGLVTVINPTRGESLGLYYSTPSRKCSILCHGFGFDSSSGKYKAVVIYTGITAGTLCGGQYEEEFLCMVGTLGSNSWSKIVIRSSEMSPIPGCPPFPFKTAAVKAWRSGTLCGSHLFWRVTTITTKNNNEIEMLLSFDIHSEKIEFIRLPTECTLTPEMTIESVHRHHLLEFQGYPCVARCEKIMTSNSDHCHHCGHYCKDKRGFCCCCFKVHLYILKDKVKQLWVKEETFVVQIKEEDLLTTPFCCSSSSATASTTQPTRIASFSDQLLLYWFDGICLTFYNLQTEHLKVARVSQTHCNRDYPATYCLTSDYQLHSQVENNLSLRTFISGGEIRKFDSWSDVKQALGSKKLPAAWVRTGRESVKYHALL